MTELLAVGAGGFIGASLRYIANKLVILAGFPLSTLVVNVFAGFCIGLVIGLDGSRLAFSPRLKLFVNTGIMGGLSTMSAFSLETARLFEDGRLFAAALNIALNVGITLAATFAGLAITRLAGRG